MNVHSSKNVETAQMSINLHKDTQNMMFHAMVYYSALKRNKALSCATTQVNLENIILSELLMGMWVVKMFQNQTVVMVLQFGDVVKYTGNHGITHMKRVTVRICELYVNKAVQKV
jgi:hypothetical protein